MNIDIGLYILFFRCVEIRIYIRDGVKKMIAKVLKSSIGKYFIVSCLVSILDLGLSYVLYKILNINYLVSCNIGIVAGFIFQYVICNKYIFKNKGFSKSFAIYLVTFVIGFALADLSMWISFDILSLPFIISKFISMAVPFFITYFIRKALLGLKASKGGN